MGLHQCTGSCDCGRFVMGCVRVLACLCGMCGHNLSVEVKICCVCVCLSKYVCVC